MTGFGEANGLSGTTACHVELKSVNNRHFKLTYRCPDGLARYEPELERVLRETISRGTVQLTLRLHRHSAAQGPTINDAVLAGYWEQLKAFCRQNAGAAPPDLGSLLGLPGVVDDGELDDEQARQWGAVLEAVVGEALGKLQEFRRREGEAMAAELRKHCGEILTHVIGLADQGPRIIAEYRNRILTRVQDLLKSSDVHLQPTDVLREVSLFADRADINEELARLKSHVDQFLTLFDAAGSQGRKLEFLCQEMFREANTIGSKSNDVGVAHTAVEIKTAIERMKEIVANVE
jgi:uncharacterized protein (TIGR00255 family)